MERLADIGRSLIAARRERGLTQADLGALVGVAQPQVARWESVAYANASLDRVVRVADALGIANTDDTLPAAVAENAAPYSTTLPGADPAALRALSRTRARPAWIAAFARAHRIVRMELFGSVLRDDFEPASDVDVLVTYDPAAAPSLFDLADHETELAAILGRAVDLVTRAGIESSENASHRESIVSDARTLYARP